MFSYRGDAHKVYLQLQKTVHKKESVNDLKELVEIEEIMALYQSLGSDILRLIYYRMVKEKNGSGFIPIFLTSVPWLLLMFSKQITDLLGSVLWVTFGFIYLFILIISVILHFREKAWAAFHMEIIQDILNERKDEMSLGSDPHSRPI
ncbi:hypothetical protein BABA_11841 [Neobacillus bataviensis LMG 21833]|uniref:Uncharacterized protein n=1 Tax=Neobacillus bataviensis LMG 21833 TaxID=1117379 RepID=K6DL93_9BACI|nr:hypothetical protein [Neobacillus bataviensis]EKN68943.1 hypothetical protein BABA_11841 [Neobacillus bataviensis LMG 21833]